MNFTSNLNGAMNGPLTIPLSIKKVIDLPKSLMVDMNDDKEEKIEYPKITSFNVGVPEKIENPIYRKEEDNIIKEYYIGKLDELGKANPKIQITKLDGTETINTVRQLYDYWVKKLEELKNVTLKGGNILLEQKIDEQKFRAIYNVKFSILRESYPTMDIPKIEDYQTPDEIKSIYDAYTKRIHIEESVNSNQTLLFILWVVIQGVGTHWFKLPMQDYIIYQYKYMKKYRLLLIELGESSHMGKVTEQWPVEFRIIYMSITGAIVYVFIQYLCNKLNLSPHKQQEIQKIVDDFFSGDKMAHAKETLKMASEATDENIEMLKNMKTEPAPQNDIPGLLNNIMGIFGGGGGGGGNAGSGGGFDIGSLLGNIMGGLSGGGGNNAQPERKKSTKIRKPFVQK